MPTSNKVLLEKADAQLTDLVSGGVLADTQAARFVQILQKRNEIMAMTHTVPMSGPTMEISKMQFAGRALRAAASGVALPKPLRSKPTFSKVNLASKLMRAIVKVPAEVFEDSIERGTLQSTIMREFSETVSRDMGDMIINSDTAHADPDLAQFDGILKAATSNVVPGGGVALTKAQLINLMKVLPPQFLENQASMKFLTSVTAEIDYRDSVVGRETAAGDTALGAFSGHRPIGYNGYDVKPIQQFPEDQGVGNNRTSVLFLNPKNVKVGVQRNIRFKMGEDISADEVLMTMTLRWDVVYQHEAAVAIANDIAV